MALQSSSLRLVERLFLTLSLVAVSAAPIPAPASPPPMQDPQDIALQSWRDHLQGIGWPQELRERWAPRFLGVLRESVANEHGGNTMTWDGSKPGLLSTVTLVLDANGKPVQRPVVQLADVLEAR
ncbi:MAG TPA: hypothetical protein VFZ65_11460 [Planctomycetota bacterium]|nr:hypothetical protein [Planctomycetota bacterium]